MRIRAWLERLVFWDKWEALVFLLSICLLVLLWHPLEPSLLQSLLDSKKEEKKKKLVFDCSLSKKKKNKKRDHLLRKQK